MIYTKDFYAAGEISQFEIATAHPNDAPLSRDKVAVKENIDPVRNDSKYAYQSIQLLSHEIIINLITVKT